jgi:hypothetical protein
MKKNMQYFSYHPEEGFELHKTAEEAKKAAQEHLEYERDQAYEGWSDNVDGICWGKLKQRVVETLNRPKTDEDTNVPTECDTIAEYDLLDLNLGDDYEH